MKYRFVHFVFDDKFINDSIKCFETANLTDNVYYYYKESFSSYLYIKSDKVHNVNKDQTSELIGNLSENDVVVLHSLYSLPPDCIYNIPRRVKVIWYAWGFDLYSNVYPLTPLLKYKGPKYQPITQAKLRYYRFVSLFYSVYQNCLSKLSAKKSSKEDYYRAIERVDYFAGVFDMEYNLMKDQCDFFKAKKITHNYIHPEEFDVQDIECPLEKNGNNILLGNSAAYLCNHLDLLYALHNKVSLQDIKIFCPLSYGGREFYRKLVIKFGKKLFGERFVPLTDYLPIDEYTSIIKSCSVFIIGYSQQAATCNCLTSMWNGLKVFVPKDSMNYDQYKNVEGLEIFNIEDDLNDSTLISNSPSNIFSQRLKISEKYSYNRWVKDLKNTLEEISKDS